MIGTTNAVGSNVTADMLGIVIKGNNTPVGASVGQYVIVKNSTISGITDGLYTAAKAIPANTTINATYLTAENNGGFNGILNKFSTIENVSSQILNINSAIVSTVSAFRLGKLIQINIQGQMINQPADRTLLFKLGSSIQASGYYFIMPATSSSGSVIGALEINYTEVRIRNPQYYSSPQRIVASILYMSV